MMADGIAGHKSPTNAPHIIVMGNEKGGCGKTTVSMHLVTALLDLGFKVGTVDIDARQRSFTRYLENRRNTLYSTGAKLPMPQHVVVNKSPFGMVFEAEEDERNRFEEAVNHLAQNDFILVDCPGSDQFLARHAHARADTVITPINDSFIDLDVIAHVNSETLEIIKPSIYSEMLWEQKLAKAKNTGHSIDWIVMRNRLSNLDAKNKRRMSDVTEQLAKRIGFRLAPGFSERVIFRELFLQGLTVIDVLQQDLGVTLSMSHLAAREEVRNLVRILSLDHVTQALKEKIQNDIQNASPRARANAKMDNARADEAAEEAAIEKETKRPFDSQPPTQVSPVAAPTAPAPATAPEDFTPAVAKLLEESLTAA